MNLLNYSIYSNSLSLTPIQNSRVHLRRNSPWQYHVWLYSSQARDSWRGGVRHVEQAPDFVAEKTAQTWYGNFISNKIPKSL